MSVYVRPRSCDYRNAVRFVLQVECVDLSDRIMRNVFSTTVVPELNRVHPIRRLKKVVINGVSARGVIIFERGAIHDFCDFNVLKFQLPSRTRPNTELLVEFACGDDFDPRDAVMISSSDNGMDFPIEVVPATDVVNRMDEDSFMQILTDCRLKFNAYRHCYVPDTDSFFHQTMVEYEGVVVDLDVRGNMVNPFSNNAGTNAVGIGFCMRF